MISMQLSSIISTFEKKTGMTSLLSSRQRNDIAATIRAEKRPGKTRMAGDPGDAR
jgi:hypothetical protein